MPNIAIKLLSGIALSLAQLTFSASAQDNAELSWTTLGTNAGPVSYGDRAQPANLLRYGNVNLLVDAGDGVVKQLASAGFALSTIPTVLISHLHSDHFGGLFALITMRFQTRLAVPLTIYGPPGTKEMVQKLFEANAPAARALHVEKDPFQWTVIELADGSAFDIGPIKVKTIANNHFASGPANDGHSPLSFSFRFDVGERSIFYTGDTGPSEAVERACRGATALVSEVLDPEASLARMIQQFPNMPPAFRESMDRHFRTLHLSPVEMAKLASKCDAKTLIVTHNALHGAEIASAQQSVAAGFRGPAFFAKDLDRFQITQDGVAR